MMNHQSVNTSSQPLSFPSRFVRSVSRVVQVYLDKSVTWRRARWVSFTGLLLVYFLRVFLLEGFYIVTYGLGIYLLNLFIGFLTPASDPDLSSDGPVLPVNESDEFRPFTRKLPEFQFWFWGIRAVIVSLALTLSPIFDLPVFWPVLLAYFIFLFAITMKVQISHMLKHRYVPWSSGKKTYVAAASKGKI